MKSKSHRYLLPSFYGTQTSHCDSDWSIVVSHGSSVTRVTGQLTDGSRGSRIVKCDPLSALLGRGKREVYQLETGRASAFVTPNILARDGGVVDHEKISSHRV